MKLKLLLSLLLTVVFITGCNVSKEEALDIAKETFESGVTSEPKEPNQETELFNYYLPPVLDIKDASDNNLILNRGNQIYLIFSNPAEDNLSTVNYDQDSVLENKAILKETYIDEEFFSYIIISPFEKDDYKVIVGIGGEKGTTITNLANVKGSIESITEVLKSITYE